MSIAKLLKESEVELVCAQERAGSGKFGKNLRRAESTYDSPRANVQ